MSDSGSQLVMGSPRVERLVFSFSAQGTIQLTAEFVAQQHKSNSQYISLVASILHAMLPLVAVTFQSKS